MTVTSIVRKAKLEDIPEGEFRDLVDRELRKDHPSISEQERAELNALAPRLRHPAVIDRWIGVLEIMKASSETQLGAKKSDLKKVYGTISMAEYQSRRRGYESWRAGNLRFLHTVQQRLLEARQIKTRIFGVSFPDRLAEERNAAAQALIEMRRAIANHKSEVLAQYDDPSDADTTLWATILHEE